MGANVDETKGLLERDTRLMSQEIASMAKFIHREVGLAEKVEPYLGGDDVSGAVEMIRERQFRRVDGKLADTIIVPGPGWQSRPRR